LWTIHTAEEEKVKALALRKNIYYWNEFFDFIFLPVGNGRKKERIFRPGSKMYENLKNRSGWVKV